MIDDDFEPLFTWLHLSDIHIGHGGAWRKADQQLVLDQIKLDILRATSPASKPEAVFVTGDVAATGAVRSRDEYRRFQAWLENLLIGLQLGQGVVFAVPGNHDVQREAPNDRSGRRTITRLRRNQQLDETLTVKEDRKFLRRRQDHFRRWFAPHARAAGLEQKDFAWLHTRSLARGLNLRVAGLNTALLSANDADHGKLAVGQSQIQATLSPQQDDEVVVALAHHPMDWLADRLHTEGWVSRLAHIYLSGHVHTADSRQVFGGSGLDLIHVSAGATHEPVEARHADPRHGYNISALGCRSDGTVVLRVWPRVWSTKRKGFIQDGANTLTDRPYAEHVLTRVRMPSTPGRPMRRRRTAKAPPASLLSLADLSRLVAHDSGRRRTAYPSDMSFAELVRRELNMEPEFTAASDVDGVGALCDRLAEGHHALLLGDPGAGKSFAAYLTVSQLVSRDIPVVTIDLRDMRGSRKRLTRPAVLRAVARRLAGPDSRVTDDGRRLAIVVDGIDELLSTGYPVDEVLEDLLALSKLGGLLATCRVREYQDLLATRIIDMHVLATVAPWDFDAQFVPFVGKLETAGRLASGRALVELVDRSRELRQLVKRPLFARMLTFVVESGRARVTDEASLYRQYLQALADATEAGLARAGRPVQGVYGHWRRALWWAHEERCVVDDGIAYLPLVQQLVTQGIDPQLAGRVVDALTDVVQVFDELRAKFLHFSFFEFLVGEEAAARLRENAGTAAPIGTTDLTVEMRHFMMRITRQTAPTDLFDRLLRSYRRSSGLPARDRMTVNNLLLYVLGRLPASRPELLQRLLRAEDNAFLRTSLYWALSNANHYAGVLEYLDVVSRDRDMASLNRGYLLYYYGDLDRSQPPPYRDDPPHTAWVSTRRRTIDMMDATDYADVPAARRLLDAATFIDFLEVRDDEPTPREHFLLAQVLAGLEPIIDDADGVVRDLLARAGGTQLAWPFAV